MDAPPTQAAGTGTAVVAAAASGTGAGGDVTNNNNNLRSSGISTAAMSNVTNAAAAIMFECDICFGVHFCEDMATVDGCAHSFCFDCIARWTSDHKHRTCPICRRVVSDIIIHRTIFPVKRNLKIVVKNFSGWRSHFYIPPKMQIRFFINLVLEYYEQRNPVREEDGIPSYAYGADVVLYYDCQEIENHYNRKVDNLGISRGDVVYIRHRIEMLIIMPDSDLWDYKFAYGWWDDKLQDFLDRFLETMELSIHDYSSTPCREMPVFKTLNLPFIIPKVLDEECHSRKS